jgi:hypothetical protein
MKKKESSIFTSSESRSLWSCNLWKTSSAILIINQQRLRTRKIHNWNHTLWVSKISSKQKRLTWPISFWERIRYDFISYLLSNGREKNLHQNRRVHIQSRARQTSWRNNDNRQAVLISNAMLELIAWMCEERQRVSRQVREDCWDIQLLCWLDDRSERILLIWLQVAREDWIARLLWYHRSEDRKHSNNRLQNRRKESKLELAFFFSSLSVRSSCV